VTSRYRVQPISAVAAAAIIAWRHPPPYDTYDFDGGELAGLLAPAYRYHELLEADELVGYCCFGDDARVPGGAYTDDALDIGWGMRPDLMGQGRGREFVAAIWVRGAGRRATGTKPATSGRCAISGTRRVPTGPVRSSTVRR